MVACVACVVCLAIAVQPPQDDTTTKKTLLGAHREQDFVLSAESRRTHAASCADRLCQERVQAADGPAVGPQHTTPNNRVEAKLLLDDHKTRRRRQEQASMNASAQEKHVSVYPLVFCKLVQETSASTYDEQCRN